MSPSKTMACRQHIELTFERAGKLAGAACPATLASAHESVALFWCICMDPRFIGHVSTLAHLAIGCFES
jgi:hypothetical protein